MGFTPVYNQFDSLIPEDGDLSNPLTHSKLSAALDAVYNGAGTTLTASLGVGVASTVAAGTVKAGTGLTVAGDGTLTPTFGTTAGTVMQGNDSRVLSAVSTTALANAGYLTASTGVTSINGLHGAVALTTMSLQDVAQTTPVSGMVLTYTGTNWAPRVPTASSGGATTFQSLTDVNVPTYVNGNILTILNNKVISVASPYMPLTGGTFTGQVVVPNTSYPNPTSTGAINAVYVAAAQAASISGSTTYPVTPVGTEEFLTYNGSANYKMTLNVISAYVQAQIAAGSSGSTSSSSSTTESAEGTTVTNTTSSIVDEYANVYKISTSAQVQTNGTAETQTANVDELYYHNHQMYQFNGTNWYTRTISGYGSFGAYNQVSSPLPAAISASNTVSVLPGVTTGQTVPATLYGLGAGALFDNNSAAAADSGVRTQAALLDIPLLRCNWDGGGNGTIFSAIFSSSTATANWTVLNNFTQYYSTIAPGSRLLITLGYPTWMNRSSASDQATYAQQAVQIATHLINNNAPCYYWELMNEQNSMNIADACNCFNALRNALQAYNSNIMVGGLTDSYVDNTRYTTFMQNCQPDFLSSHLYLCEDNTAWENGSSNSAIMSAAAAAAGWATSLRNLANSLGYSKTKPIFLGEWNTDGYWYNGLSGYVAGSIMTKYVNAVMAALTLYSHISADVNVTMGGYWEIVYDSDYGVIQSNTGTTIIPAGYLLSKSASSMPGALVSTAIGQNLSNFAAYATQPTTSTFALQLINYDTSTSRTIDCAVSGATGNIAYWEIGTNYQSTPHTATITASGLSSITVAPLTVIVLTGSFSGGTTSTVSSGTTYSAFDPANTSSLITLSNSDATATYTGSTGAGGTRTTSSHSTGLWYAEFVFNPGTLDSNFGITTGTDGSAQGYFGNDLNSCGIYPFGQTSPYENININNVSKSSNTTFKDATNSSVVVGIAVNFTASKIWFTTTAMQAANTPWNSGAIGSQNPAGNIGGVDISGLNAGPYYLAFGADSGCGGTLNTGAASWSSALGIPSGYTAWG